MPEDGSHIQRHLMRNHNSFSGSKFILQLFIWGRGLQLAEKWDESGSKEESSRVAQRQYWVVDEFLKLQGLLVLGCEENC